MDEERKIKDEIQNYFLVILIVYKVLNSNMHYFFEKILIAVEQFGLNIYCKK